MKKSYDIRLIPSKDNKFTNIAFGAEMLGLRFTKTPFKAEYTQYFNIILTNNDALKIGDTYYNADDKIATTIKSKAHLVSISHLKNSFKIFASTDKNLTPESFIDMNSIFVEYYIKNLPKKAEVDTVDDELVSFNGMISIHISQYNKYTKEEIKSALEKINMSGIYDMLISNI